MVEWDKENQENLENGLPTRDIMEFSPPAKMPKNSPSYLIWSIFTRSEIIYKEFDSIIKWRMTNRSFM